MFWITINLVKITFFLAYPWNVNIQLFSFETISISDMYVNQLIETKLLIPCRVYQYVLFNQDLQTYSLKILIRHYYISTNETNLQKILKVSSIDKYISVWASNIWVHYMMSSIYRLGQASMSQNTTWERIPNYIQNHQLTRKCKKNLAIMNQTL